jgi:hypothetical protein
MADFVKLPPEFDPRKECDKFLRGVKKRASTKFSYAKATSLRTGAVLAYWLYVFGRPREALEVCRFLGLYDLEALAYRWDALEPSLTIQSRILREIGKRSAAAACMKRVRDAGPHPSRVTGEMVFKNKGNSAYLQQVEYCIAENRKSGERGWRRCALVELCFIIEMGGSKKCPVVKAEKEFQNQMEALRKMLKIGLKKK